MSPRKRWILSSPAARRRSREDPGRSASGNPSSPHPRSAPDRCRPSPVVSPCSRAVAGNRRRSARLAELAQALVQRVRRARHLERTPFTLSAYFGEPAGGLGSKPVFCSISSTAVRPTTAKSISLAIAKLLHDARPVHAVIDGVGVIEPGGELAERLQFAPGGAGGRKFAPAVGEDFGHRSDPPLPHASRMSRGESCRDRFHNRGRCKHRHIRLLRCRCQRPIALRAPLQQTAAVNQVRDVRTFIERNKAPHGHGTEPGTKSHLAPADLAALPGAPHPPHRHEVSAQQWAGSAPIPHELLVPPACTPRMTMSAASAAASSKNSSVYRPGDMTVRAALELAAGRSTQVPQLHDPVRRRQPRLPISVPRAGTARCRRTA